MEGGGREGSEECRVGLGGAGCWREKRGLYVGLYLGSREIKDVCECIDASVFSYCVYSTGAHCLPDSDGDDRRVRGDFFIFFFLFLFIYLFLYLYVCFGCKGHLYICVFCDLFCGTSSLSLLKFYKKCEVGRMRAKM